jgi:hypothetical protein
VYVRTSDGLKRPTLSALIKATSGEAEDQIAPVAGLGSLCQARDGATFQGQGLGEDKQLRGLSGADIRNSLGVGVYNGELRRGADGQLYEWVQSVDGLGNVSGFWKSLSKVARAVAKPVVRAAAPVVQAATDVAKGALRFLTKPYCIPLLPLRSPIRFIAKAICPIVQQPIIRRIAPIVPYVGPIIQGTDRLCNLVRDCGIAGLEGGLIEAPDGNLYQARRGLQNCRTLNRYIRTSQGLGQVTFPESGGPSVARPLTEREVMLVAKSAGDLWGDKLGNIDVYAQRAIVRLSKNPLTAADAHALLDAVKSRELRGIFIENQKVPALRAQKLGTWYGKLIPAGEDSVVVPAPAGSTEPPLIAFRDSVKANPARLDSALVKASRKLFPALVPASGTVLKCTEFFPTVPSHCKAR